MARLTLDRVLDLSSLSQVLLEELILRCEAHVSNLALDVSKDGLEQLVLLL